MTETRRGAARGDLLHSHRTAAAHVLVKPDGRRAAPATLSPVAKVAVTSDDVLAYTPTKQDEANVERVLAVASRLVGTEVDKQRASSEGCFAGAPGEAGQRHP